ncbi:MAG: RsmE family RNA methyltransferase, partial [Phormidesmis sp.]
MVQRITISPQQQQGSLIVLRSDQVHYLVRVLRLQRGDRFIAQNGQGQQWLAKLGEQSDRAQILEELIASDSQPFPPIRLIAALPKGNGFDQVVRQTTELGVSHIYPVITERTLLRPSESKLARWRRIAEEASEQSERVTVPTISEPVDFQQCIEHPAWTKSENSLEEELRCLCTARSVCESAQNPQLLAHLLTHQSADCAPANLRSVILAIGPEGGWTQSEITVAMAC